MTAGQLMAHAEFAVAGEKRDSMLLLGSLLQIPSLELSLARDRELSPELLSLFWRQHSRLAGGEPLQYILGRAWFGDLELEVSPAVLIPRPETEDLVQIALRWLRPGMRALDVGTGSGAIAISLKLAVPEAEIIATDISPAAMELAARNAERYGAAISWVEADLFPAAGTRCGLIVSNPPYIAPDEYAALEPRVREFEPRKALLAEENGLLFYRRILEGARDYLTPEGVLLFEHGDLQRQAILALATDLGWECVLAERDLAGRDRYLGFMTKKG